ncbi:MAG: hemolysin family protein [Thermodesulfobacteriota bacterium]|nr:hemolysin family protein [Thermodesulfobacteriota bacterium]
MVELILLLICILGSAFASGSETALVSASRIRLRHLASQGINRANRALRLLDQKERSLVVTLIATNVFNIAAGVIATVTLQRWIGSLAPVVATVAMTSILLVVSEIVPKAYFRYHAEQSLSRAAIIWRFLSWIMAPITFPISLVTNLLFRLFRRKPKSLYTTREEIKLVLEESVESGGLRQHQQEMLESALDYATTIVREVMVPISDVALIPETGRTDELLTLVREQGHTRIPVYRDRVDQIVAFVNVFDIFYDRDRKTFIRPYMRQARLVPDTKRIDKLFVEMQRERESLAIVVSEFGACFGIVTLEDIIEEIFGELTDEHENHVREIQQEEPGHFRVSGSTDIDDLKDETDIAIKKAGFETVAGYVLHHMGRIPRKGETFTDGDLRVRILEADRYSVKIVEIIQKNEASAPE